MLININSKIELPHLSAIFFNEKFLRELPQSQDKKIIERSFKL